MTVKDFATFNPDTTQEKITLEGLKNSSSNLIPSGTLIISTRMALGKAVIYNVNISINQDLKALFIKSNINTQFLFYWFLFKAELIEDMGSGSPVMGLSLNDLRQMNFSYPPKEIQEQIAQILSDMDTEIERLEAQLAKWRRVKEGMMQCLLTGQRRLVVGITDWGGLPDDTDGLGWVRLDLIGWV